MQNGTLFSGSRPWEGAEMKRLILPLIATAYGALGAILIILFAVLESLVSEALEARMGLSNLADAALAGAVVTLIVIPLRVRYSKWMDELIPREARSTIRERSC